MKDETNRKNIKTLLSFIGVFILCILAFVVLAVFAGSSIQNPSLGSMTTPMSHCYHDHRL